MIDSAGALRRWLGMFFLAVAFGMMIWGQIVLQPHLQGVVFTLYWGACFAFSLAAIVVALLDIRAVLRNIKAERKAHYQKLTRETAPATPSQRETSPSPQEEMLPPA